RQYEFILRVMKRDVPLRQPTLCRRHAAERELAEHLVFRRDRRVVGQVLRRDDLIGVDVVAEDVGLAFDDRLHDFTRTNLAVSKSVVYVSRSRGTSGCAARTRNVNPLFSRPSNYSFTLMP